MKYAAIKSCDIANGPGVRVSLFVSGCRHHCKDCFNPETWDFAYGQPFDEAVMEHILALMAPDYIRGITYLGGEPFEPENQPGLLALSRKIRAAYPEKSIWSFSGYLFDRDILARKLGPWETTREPPKSIFSGSFQMFEMIFVCGKVCRVFRLLRVADAPPRAIAVRHAFRQDLDVK